MTEPPIYRFNSVWTEESFEGTPGQFKQFIEQNIPEIKQWVMDSKDKFEMRYRSKIFRQCNRLNRSIENCHSMLVVRDNLAKIYFKHDTDDHVITTIAFAHTINKCDMCNGQLSPKGRPHNCPGDVI